MLTLTVALAFAAAAAHLFIAVRAVRSRAKADIDARAPLAWLTAAAAATAIWAALLATDRIVHSTWPGAAAGAADALRLAAWLGLMWALMPGLSTRAGAGRWLRALSLAVVAALAASWAVRVAIGRPAVDAVAWGVPIALAAAVLGLVLLEQLARNLPDEAQWSAKPLGLALALTFAVDVYLYAEALLLGRVDPEEGAVRAAAQVIAAPLLLLATRRQGLRSRRLQLSRGMAFHSATLVLVGGYQIGRAHV